MKEWNSRVGRVAEPMKTDFLQRTFSEPAEGQVLIRVVSSAVCGSDLHIFKGRHPAVPLPVTIGHEFSGDIVAVGPGVDGLCEGDRVTLEPCIVCGTCEACRRGNYGYCENISFSYRKGDGAMADYVMAQAEHVFRLPDDLSYHAGALIEPLSVATHAVRRADVRLGETVLVIGAGAIGLLIAAVCRKSGASQVIIADHSDARLKLALELGATAAVNSGKEPLEDVLHRLTGGKGVDKSFECVGLEATFVQAISSIRQNGLATIVGIFENPKINIPADLFVSREIRVQGAQGYCWDFPVAIELSRELNLEKLVTHVFPLDDLQKALETCLDRSAGSVKVLLEP